MSSYVAMSAIAKMTGEYMYLQVSAPYAVGEIFLLRLPGPKAELFDRLAFDAQNPRRQY
jgi:hypothetical protein